MNTIGNAAADTAQTGFLIKTCKQKPAIVKPSNKMASHGTALLLWKLLAKPLPMMAMAHNSTSIVQQIQNNKDIIALVVF